MFRCPLTSHYKTALNGNPWRKAEGLFLSERLIRLEQDVFWRSASWRPDFQVH
jgi:hypothetical protein